MAVKIPPYNGHLTKNFGYQEMIKSSTADRLGIQMMHQENTLSI